VLFLRQESRLQAISTETSERRKEFEHLKKLEQADKEAKEREAAEIIRYEQELAQLDTKILEMKKRLGTTLAKEDDSLDAMLAMVRQKEDQQRRLEELKRKKEQEEARRLAEIERLKAEKRQKLLTAVEEDIRKYNQIVSSPYGHDLKEKAWNQLVNKYPEAGEGVDIGDARRLLAQVKWSNVELIFTNSIGMNFVLIPCGTFVIGSPLDELGRGDDERQHEVTLSKGLYMQTTEVTQGQWRLIMGSNPSLYKDCGDFCPVERITWYDAQDFIGRLNQREANNKYRLPTEAEWECACRSGSMNRFCCCDSKANIGEYAWYNKNSRGKTHPVVLKKASAWGLYDMNGNVWEWCEDWYPSVPI